MRTNTSGILSFIRFLNFVLVKVTVKKIRSTTPFEIAIIKQNSAYTATFIKSYFSCNIFVLPHTDPKLGCV